MARLESQQTIRVSGWSLTIVPTSGEFSTLTDEIMEELRRDADPKMKRAQEEYVRGIKETLSRQYPLIRAGGIKHSADPMVRSIRRERSFRKDRRQSSPPGTPPGLVMGDLRRSWRVGLRKWTGGKTVLTGYVYSKHPGAGPHEFGSPAGSPNAPQWPRGLPSRPYVRPTLIRIGDKLSQILDGPNG